LVESTLFGTTKGSYTGATDKKGLFEEASSGTLFLDELNSMNIEIQAKILRAIQTKTIRRIGSEKEISVNPRIISAVNIDPLICIQQNKLRADLFYRIAAVSIDIPPLRHRISDVSLLTKHIIRKYNAIYDREIEGVSSTVTELFLQYKWPGNVRELEHIIEHAINMLNPDENIIQKEHLPLYFLKQISDSEEIYIQSDFKKAREQALSEAEKEFTQNFVTVALKRHRGNISQTAEELKISRQYLHTIINKYHIILD
ncbi:MAG: sigma 54-interacting transcriptional regulator, partial [Clostridia bacterium]